MGPVLHNAPGRAVATLRPNGRPMEKESLLITPVRASATFSLSTRRKKATFCRCERFWPSACRVWRIDKEGSSFIPQIFRDHVKSVFAHEFDLPHCHMRPYI